MKRKSPPSGDLLLVWMTVPNRKTALKLSHLLVDGRLAACVNILPGLQSRYWWKGKVETASEDLLVAKTTKAQWAKLESVVRKNHPYEICEVIAWPLERGSAPYFKWIAESLSPVPQKR
jgi:periplasmic divalent cation tolerance protein